MHNRLGELLDALMARGYRFVRVDELLHAGAATIMSPDLSVGGPE